MSFRAAAACCLTPIDATSFDNPRSDFCCSSLDNHATPSNAVFGDGADAGMVTGADAGADADAAGAECSAGPITGADTGCGETGPDAGAGFVPPPPSPPLSPPFP